MRLILTESAWTTSISTSGAVHHRQGPGASLASIEEKSGGATLRQDLIRSFPLFYGLGPDDSWVVSDSAPRLAAELGVCGLNQAAAEEFRHLGYVSGAATLHPRIFQVQSGETIDLNDGAAARTVSTRSIGSSGTNIRDERAADERFSAALERAFDGLLSTVDGRQVVVPLSGGLDSRLIAVLLKDAGYDNVLNFTYGVGDTSEARVSRAVAKALDQAWELVDYDVADMRTAWTSGEGAAFVTDTYAGSALPHIQDWFALRHLREREIIAADAVFLPGHTIVGNMHDEAILDATGDVSAPRIAQIIRNHHARLQPDSARAALPAYMTGIETELHRLGYDGSPQSRLVAIENANVRERQAKYINNSMRAYEHFGYEWAMPMLEEPVLQAWEDLDISLRRNRDWYSRFIARRYEAVSGAQLPTFAPTSLSARSRDRIKAMLRVTGLLTYAERRQTARAYASHPMGFQAFLPEADNATLRRTIMRGGNPFGVFADRFLADKWAPGQSLFH